MKTSSECSTATSDDNGSSGERDYIQHKVDCEILLKFKSLKKTCSDCGSSTSSVNKITGKPRGFCANKDCDAFLCKRCKDSHSLIPLRTENDKCTWKTAKIERFCKECYKSTNILDFSRKSDVIEPQDVEKPRSGVTIVFLHGAGGCRASYHVHSQALADQHGHRGITVDLAGHGTRWDEKCTMENCLGAVKEALHEHGIKTSQEEAAEERYTFLCGGSWGGFIGYYIMEELPEYFCGAIFEGSTIDITQKKSWLYWKAITKVLSHSSSYNQMKFVRRKWSRANLLFSLETKFACGIYGKADPFGAIEKWNFWESIPNINCPCLFLLGTDDKEGYDKKTHKKIISLLPQREKCVTKFFPGGDHLYSSTEKHFTVWVDTCHRFIENSINQE